MVELPVIHVFDGEELRFGSLKIPRADPANQEPPPWEPLRSNRHDIRILHLHGVTALREMVLTMSWTSVSRRLPISSG